MVNPESVHTSHILWVQQTAFKNIYVCVCVFVCVCVCVCVCVYTSPRKHVIKIDDKRDQDFKGECGKAYGKILREKRERRV
jgi:short subunit fatty acids transporter